jgi:hypothetical protein
MSAHMIPEFITMQSLCCEYPLTVTRDAKLHGNYILMRLPDFSYLLKVYA